MVKTGSTSNADRRLRTMSFLTFPLINFVTTDSYHLVDSQLPPLLAETVRQMIANHGPLVKPRPNQPAIGGLKRQGSLDSALPTPLNSQVKASVNLLVYSVNYATTKNTNLIMYLKCL